MNETLLGVSAQADKLTKLLMHFDAVGTRNYICEVGTPIVAPINAGLIRNDGKIGGCGFYYVGASAGIVSADLNWAPDGGDWTFEFWCNRFGVGTYGVSKAGQANAVEVRFTSGGNVDFYIGGVMVYSVGTHLVGLNAAWGHIAVENYGGKHTIFTNGFVRHITTADQNQSIGKPVFRPFNVMTGDNESYERRVDEMRVSSTSRYKGVAFTPSLTNFELD